MFIYKHLKILFLFIFLCSQCLHALLLTLIHKKVFDAIACACIDKCAASSKHIREKATRTTRKTKPSGKPNRMARRSGVVPAKPLGIGRRFSAVRSLLFIGFTITFTSWILPFSAGLGSHNPRVSQWNKRDKVRKTTLQSLKVYAYKREYQYSSDEYCCLVAYDLTHCCVHSFSLEKIEHPYLLDKKFSPPQIVTDTLSEYCDNPKYDIFDTIHTNKQKIE